MLHTNIKAVLFRVVKRVVLFALSLLFLSIFVFIMARLAPGDPLRAYYGESVERMSQTQRASAAATLGLDRPLLVQYGIWLTNALHGNFGISFQYKRDVLAVIGSVWQNTALLAGTAFVLICLLSLLLGAICCYQEDSWLDKLLCKIGIVSNCIPSFLLSLGLILIFSVWLRLLPSGGVGSGSGGQVRHLVLPVCALLLGHVWYYAYNVRNLLCEQARQDYVLLCRAKGLSRRKTLLLHCLPNIVPSYASMMAVFVPHLLGGTYIVEKIFSYPGLGTLCVEGIMYHDYHMVMTICLITGIIVMLFGFISRIIGRDVPHAVENVW